MERIVTGWHRDEVGDWVAELSCLHGQHVRHQPPFREAPWVASVDERTQRIGTAWDCPLCDRAELPDGLVVVRTTATWGEATVPDGLRKDHRVAAGRWGRLRITDGSLRFHAVGTEPPIDRTLTAGEEQPIPPDVEHHIELIGPVRCCVDFLARPEGEERGGDPACWAHLGEEGSGEGG